MKKWIIGGVIFVVLLILGLIIWFKLRSKSKVEELDPHMQKLAKEVAEGKHVDTSKEKKHAEQMQVAEQEIKLQQEKINSLGFQLIEAQERIQQFSGVGQFQIVENPLLKDLQKQGKQPQKQVPKTTQVPEKKPKAKVVDLDVKKTAQGKKTAAEMKAWEQAKATNTIEGYEEFLQGDYGSKVCFGAAHSLIKRLMTAKITDNNG